MRVYFDHFIIFVLWSLLACEFAHAKTITENTIEDQFFHTWSQNKLTGEPIHDPLKDPTWSLWENWLIKNIYTQQSPTDAKNQCLNHQSNLFLYKNETLPKLNEETNPTPMIAKKCILASQQSGNVSNGFVCAPNPNKKGQIDNTPLRNAQSYDSEQPALFLQWALKSAMDCLAPHGVKIDPALLFLIINRESHFYYHVGSKDGKGLMQLTTNGYLTANARAEEIKFNYQCANLNDLDLNFDMVLWKKKEVIPICDFVAPGKATLRNIITGLLHMDASRVKDERDKNTTASNQIKFYNGLGDRSYLKNLLVSFNRTAKKINPNHKDIKDINQALTWTEKNCIEAVP